jgi:site-specific DNA-methyltransferase (adenine-specific)
MTPYFETALGRLYHGDCLEILPKLGPVDLVLTDPPYSTPTVASFGRRICKHLGDLAIQEFYFKEVVARLERILSPCSPILFFCDDVYVAILTAIFYHYHQTNILVWDKGKIGMGSPFRRQHEFIFYAANGPVKLNPKCSHLPTVFKVPFTKQYHGAEKPASLIMRLIGGLSDEAAIVIDPFFGSGTTAVACERLGRKWIGIEISEQYCEIAAKRIEAEAAQLKLFA